MPNKIESAPPGSELNRSRPLSCTPRVGSPRWLPTALILGSALTVGCDTFQSHMPDRTSGPSERPLQLKSIGVIRTPFSQPKGTPIQPRMAGVAEGTVEVLDEFQGGLKDLDGFERIWLIYWFDRAPGTRLRVTPFLDSTERGLFATRAPTRPNAIGMSAVRLLKVENGVLTVAGIDVLDGTPLLDIKPYVPLFDSYEASKAGWVDESTQGRELADDRFEREMKLSPNDLKEKVKAVVIVLATPMNRNGSLDLPGLRANTRFLAERCRGKRFVFVPTGSTGEAYALSDAERLSVIETVMRRRRTPRRLSPERRRREPSARSSFP